MGILPICVGLDQRGGQLEGVCVLWCHMPKLQSFRGSEIRANPNMFESLWQLAKPISVGRRLVASVIICRVMWFSAESIFFGTDSSFPPKICWHVKSWDLSTAEKVGGSCHSQNMDQTNERAEMNDPKEHIAPHPITPILKSMTRSDLSISEFYTWLALRWTGS